MCWIYIKAAELDCTHYLCWLCSNIKIVLIIRICGNSLSLGNALPRGTRYRWWFWWPRNLASPEAVVQIQPQKEMKALPLRPSSLNLEGTVIWVQFSLIFLAFTYLIQRKLLNPFFTAVTIQKNLNQFVHCRVLGDQQAFVLGPRHQNTVIDLDQTSMPYLKSKSGIPPRVTWLQDRWSRFIIQNYYCPNPCFSDSNFHR